MVGVLVWTGWVYSSVIRCMCACTLMWGLCVEVLMHGITRLALRLGYSVGAVLLLHVFPLSTTRARNTS